MGFHSLDVRRSCHSWLIRGYMLTVLTLHTSLHQDMFVFNVPWANGGTHLWTVNTPVLRSSSSHTHMSIQSCCCPLRPCCVCVCVWAYWPSLYPVQSAPPLCVAPVLLCGSVVAAVVWFWSKWCHGLDVSPKANHVSIHSTTISFLCIKEDEKILFPQLLHKIYFLAWWNQTQACMCECDLFS